MEFLQNKFRLKALLAGYERNSVRIIADGLVNNRAKALILKQIRHELRKYGKLCRLRSDEMHNLWNHSYKLLYKTGKKTWGKKNSTEIYTVIRDDLVYNREFVKIKNEIANRHEEISKFEWIRDLLDESATPFYLSDAHKGCSSGHLEYENRIYYDADFKRRYEFDSETVAEIENYIAVHDLMSVQEVTGDGIWLITRPNCKHRLIPIPMEDVLHGKRIQKVEVAAQEQSYPGGERLFYYERGRILKDLQAVVPCLELDKDLDKTVKLVRKWSKM